jgi:hypothetical protein
MPETLLRYQKTVIAEDGTEYEARACGGPVPAGTWEGWIEFVPVGGGPALRSPRETTQPNRTDTEYWATGLTQVFLEGALQRALDVIAPPTPVPPAPPPTRSLFPGPAPSSSPAPSSAAHSGAPESVLDPFSVYEKGEALLRRQLSALSAWHLVNIIVAYELSDEESASLSRRPAAELIEIIVSGVRSERATTGRRT